mmetsp:Transcript_65096/g.172434  ORF Transcript_65096/g.172434 Transcript_65096/m.172434 type:complete len:306 (-) Transcript_65096:5-922(-)
MPLPIGTFLCHGADQKCNWLLVRHVPAARRCVIFFPGDISDWAEGDDMYRYSLEALMWVVCTKYPNDTVVTVRPRMLVNMSAIYVNFMFVDGRGNPRSLAELRKRGDAAKEGEQGEEEERHELHAEQAELAGDTVSLPRACEHLLKLLASLENEIDASLPATLVLVGFSKGAAVLSALLREDEPLLSQRLESVHFVDAGLHVPGVFPLDDQELQSLAQKVDQNFTLWLHGTPRQMQDEQRPFVALEAAAFLERCAAAGLCTEQRSYGAGRCVTLNLHFDSLRCFFTSREDTDGGDVHCGFFDAWE